MRRLPPSLLATAIAATGLVAQAPPTQPDWTSVEAEALGHYQALIRHDTVTSERAAAEYIKQVLDKEGIAARILFTDPERPNVVDHRGRGDAEQLRIHARGRTRSACLRASSSASSG